MAPRTMAVIQTSTLTETLKVTLKVTLTVTLTVSTSPHPLQAPGAPPRKGKGEGKDASTVTTSQRINGKGKDASSVRSLYASLAAVADI